MQKSSKDESPNLFGARLRRLRIAGGYNKARHFAAAIGISENRYTRYERGEAEPSIGLILRICEELATRPDILLGIIDMPTAKSQLSTPGFSEYAPYKGLHLEYDQDDVERLAFRPPKADILAWRLARLITDVDTLNTAAPPAAQDARLGELIRTAATYKALQQDPYGTISALLDRMDQGDLPTMIQCDLGEAIAVFLGALDIPAS